MRDSDHAPHQGDASELRRSQCPRGDQRSQQPGHEDGSVRGEKPARIAQELAGGVEAQAAGHAREAS
jgi:hypothetical protein